MPVSPEEIRETPKPFMGAKAWVWNGPFNDPTDYMELRSLAFGSFLLFSQMRSLETCSTNSALPPLSIDTSPEMQLGQTGPALKRSLLFLGLRQKNPLTMPPLEQRPHPLQAMPLLPKPLSSSPGRLPPQHLRLTVVHLSGHERRRGGVSG